MGIAPKLFDTHCHLAMSELKEDLDSVFDRAYLEGVKGVLAVASNEEDSLISIDIAKNYSEVVWGASVGIHPHEAERYSGKIPLDLQDQAERNPVVAVGETGLDYYYDNSPRELQRELFVAHIGLAKQVEKPLIMHVRDAFDDAYVILREEGLPQKGGIVHCFSGSYNDAKKALDMGLYISFSGILTFPKASELRETAKKIPLDRLLCETDAPYLAPVPKRGKRNEPSFVKYVYEVLASVKGVTIEDLAEQICLNIKILFDGVV